MLDWPEKLSGTNTLAYFAPPSVTKKKSFITLTPAHHLRKKVSVISINDEKQHYKNITFFSQN